MRAKTLCKLLRNCPADYKVGILIHRPDGDEFYEVESKDISLCSNTTDGDELPFGAVILGSFTGDRVEEDDPTV